MRSDSHRRRVLRSTDVVSTKRTVQLPPFQALVDAHWREVSRLAHALAGPTDGDDVAQRAWEKAFAAYPGLTSAKNLRGWLLTITARCATDVHRARRPQVPLTDDLPVAVDGPELPDEELWRAVARLPERQRTAVALKYVADLDHTAIAAELGTTPAASRRLVSDALAVLRKEFGDHD
jgi:RNA polymerase sigma factor (sigma-70 family)